MTCTELAGTNTVPGPVTINMHPNTRNKRYNGNRPPIGSYTVQLVRQYGIPPADCTVPGTPCTSTPLADGWFTVCYKGIGVYQS